jgi:hypothetical protein
MFLAVMLAASVSGPKPRLGFDRLSEVLGLTHVPESFLDG